jgi:hydroxyacylglutathione hydrolase
MLLRRFYSEPLAQASFLVGCPETGEALVVDANRDVRHYVAAARAEGLRITHVTETHIHADFVSGSRELAQVTGAQLLLSAEGGSDWQYVFASEGTALRHGSQFAIGRVRVDAVHTPGHTPEHLVFLLTDTAVSNQVLGALTGDFLFVGDVGRPDLLERAAHVSGTMEAAARDLWRSLQRFAELPDYLQIWPGHGAGSACGKSLGSMPHTTLGYERLTNWAFQCRGEDEFVRSVLSGQPEPPRYFGAMKRMNRGGPAPAPDVSGLASLNAGELQSALKSEALIVDTRSAREFASSHVPGTMNIPHNRAFLGWIGWLAPYGRDLYLIAQDAGKARKAASECALIGVDRVAGAFLPEAVVDWQRDGGAPSQGHSITPADLHRRLARGEVRLIDVRTREEWCDGHIAGAENVPLPQLLGEVRLAGEERPIVVQCLSGSRSAIAASLFDRAGARAVFDLTGGLDAWEKAGLPVARSDAR